MKKAFMLRRILVATLLGAGAYGAYSLDSIGQLRQAAPAGFDPETRISRCVGTATLHITSSKGAPLDEDLIGRALFSFLKVGTAAAPELLSGPANLLANAEPWTRLQFQVEGIDLLVKNPTKNEVRIAPLIELLPHKRFVQLPISTIPAGQTLTIKNVTAGISTKSVLIQPETSRGRPKAWYEMRVR